MEELVHNSTALEGGDFLDGTSDPSISVLTDDVPTLTVAAILGVTVVVLIAIAVVFVLGILVDCRQQRLLTKKLGELNRMKNHKRPNYRPDADVVSIAQNMEEPELTAAPANVLERIP